MIFMFTNSINAEGLLEHVKPKTKCEKKMNKKTCGV